MQSELRRRPRPRARRIAIRPLFTPTLLRAAILPLCAAIPLMLAAPARADLDLPLYGELLNEFTRAVPDVAGTRIDYPGLRDSADWKRLVSGLAKSQPSRMRRNDQLAFWVNAYNILAIDLVRRHYPVDSIKDIGSLFTSVWKKDVVEIEGDEISLHSIEHEILRPMGDPRIHAAIVCASTSCPSLTRVPFEPKTLDAQLTAAMSTFLADDHKGMRIDRAGSSVMLSKIFDWFEEDFTPEERILRALVQFARTEDKDWLRENERRANISYFEYDWSLNSIANTPKRP